MATTYVKIASTTVGSGGASSIDFSSIPNTYTDLQILFSLRGSPNYTTAPCNIRFNGDTASNYLERLLYGTGTAVASASATRTLFGWGAIIPGNTATASTFGNAMVYIPNYTSSNNKSVLLDSVQENNNTEGYQYVNAGLWTNTAVISSISIFPDAGQTFVQYSTATLYGIKNS